MYYIEDKPAAIKEIQGYLRGVGYDILPVIISGVFDDNTSAAVRDFQEKNSLEPTGRVNYDTFVLLYQKYTLETGNRRIREKYDSFIAFPVSPGMRGKEIEYINDILIEILDYYGHYHNVRRGGFFSTATKEGVILLQELFAIPPTGIVDEQTYERMLTERDSIFNFTSS